MNVNHYFHEINSISIKKVKPAGIYFMTVIIIAVYQNPGGDNLCPCKFVEHECCGGAYPRR